jgi:hypothetical protein
MRSGAWARMPVRSRSTSRAGAVGSPGRRAGVLARALHVLDPGEQELLGKLVSRLLARSVPRASAAEKVCRLCDYSACVECPFQGLDASGR